MVTGAVSGMGIRAKLRGLKGTDGHPIFVSSMQGATPYALDGAPMYFPQNGSFDETVAQLIVGNWSEAVYSIRQDVTVKILTESIIQDPVTKNIVYNLAQQDMIALRVKFRAAWARRTRQPYERRAHELPVCVSGAATAATTYAVTFTVKDNATSPAVISGAMVDVEGARKKTGADGTAVFNLFPGSYDAKVTKKGCKPLRFPSRSTMRLWHRRPRWLANKERRYDGVCKLRLLSR